MKQKQIRASEETGILFENNKLEKFTQIKPFTAVFFYGSIWLVLIVLNSIYTYNSIQKSLFLYFIALCFWTLFEYLAHRFVFHFVTESSKVKTFHRFIHGIHHEYPRDVNRLIMPPLPGLAILFFLFGIYYLILGDKSYIFLAGFLNGWAIYVSIHYIIHAYKPIKGFKFLWRHHAKHHYQQENKAFGVSSPIWDWFFGTLPT